MLGYCDEIGFVDFRGRRFFGMLTQTLHSFQEKENEKKVGESVIML